MKARRKRRVKENPRLPSGDAAIDFVKHPDTDTGATALGTMVARGTVVAAGLYLSGARGTDLVKYTIGTSLALEVGVLLWGAWQVYAEGH